MVTLGKIILEKRWAHLDAASDERLLGDMAYAMGCSVYNLFEQAGAEWNFSRNKIDADFKIFIRNDQIPPYLQHFLHRRGRSGEKTYQELLYSGGRPPYL